MGRAAVGWRLALMLGASGALHSPRFLCDVRTPSAVIDVDALGMPLDALAACGRAERAAALRRALYVHARVARAAPPRARPGARSAAREALDGGGDGAAREAFAVVDCALPPGGCYLALGLNNGFDASYFWARALGQGARRQAPGVGVRAAADGRAEFMWLSEADALAAGLKPQTPDGKYSEWAEFLRAGDEVDLVPFDPAAALGAFGGALVGVRRSGRPPGAEPVVEGTITLAAI